MNTWKQEDLGLVGSFKCSFCTTIFVRLNARYQYYMTEGSYGDKKMHKEIIMCDSSCVYPTIMASPKTSFAQIDKEYLKKYHLLGECDIQSNGAGVG